MKYADAIRYLRTVLDEESLGKVKAWAREYEGTEVRLPSGEVVVVGSPVLGTALAEVPEPVY